MGGVGIFQEYNNGMFCGMQANVKKKDTVNAYIDQSVVEVFTLY